MDRKKIWTAALLGVFFCLQTVQVFRRIPPEQTLFELPYQFGPYSWSLLRLGKYADCSQPPCKHASRMPVLPLTLDALGRVSLLARTTALLKNGLLLLLTGAALFWLLDVHTRLFPGRGRAWLALVPLALALPVIRHSAMIEYEEGLLTEPALLWALCFLLGAWCWASKGREGGRLLAVCVALATLIYMTKDAFLPAWLATLALAALWALRGRDVKVLLVLVCCVAVVLGWGLRNRLAAGRFSIGTSWDGENAYRGFNSESAMIYPDLSLDEVLQPPHVSCLADGHAVVLGGRWPSFPNEWAWNDYFYARAAAWARSHARIAARFQERKFAHFFFSIGTADFEGPFSPAERAWETASLLAGRLAELALAVLLAALWRTRSRPKRVLALAVLAANAAYAAPYVICFNYERHIAVYFTVVAASVFAVLSALPQGGPGPDADAPERNRGGATTGLGGL